MKKNKYVVLIKDVVSRVELINLVKENEEERKNIINSIKEEDYCEIDNNWSEENSLGYTFLKISQKNTKLEALKEAYDYYKYPIEWFKVLKVKEENIYMYQPEIIKDSKIKIEELFKMLGISSSCVFTSWDNCLKFLLKKLNGTDYFLKDITIRKYKPTDIEDFIILNSNGRKI